jgi:DNA-binding HxlR family transcriptional regulator
VSKRLATYFHCPTEFTLAVLGGKWKTVILSYLKERPCRYAELRRLVPRLSDKVLTERLRDLTRSGLVARQEPTASRTHTYFLTEKGRSLSELLQQLYAWGLKNSGSFGVRVGAPLEELDAQQKGNRVARSLPARNRAHGRETARVRGA